MEYCKVQSNFHGRTTNKIADADFEQQLKAVRRSALEQKKAEEVKEFGPTDYDAPVEKEDKTIGLRTKIGVGVVVLVFGLVFVLRDFLPSGKCVNMFESDNPSEETTVASKNISEEEKSALQLTFH